MELDSLRQSAVRELERKRARGSPDPELGEYVATLDHAQRHIGERSEQQQRLRQQRKHTTT